ncbi:membrane protein insertion efficiency factor YidD [Pannus brasiliensis CCIBt3594]|uniref:Membrane protein insertion efficiency factor YidD n=1 Tax=Pannus brasiliensis CCIBt3594 TaxID=1427578 RepID=A0AAW9QWH7_9CHRO
MNVSALTRQTAFRSIEGYQKYISPKKGFSCPHRLLHGGVSCSDYVKERILSDNLGDIVRFSVRRFQDCAKTGRALKSSASGGCIIVPCCLPIPL